MILMITNKTPEPRSSLPACASQLSEEHGLAFPSPHCVDEGSEVLRTEMSCWKSYNSVTVVQPTLSACLLSLGHGYGRKENSSNPDPENSSGLGKSDLVGKNVWGKGVSQEDAPQTLRSGNLVCSSLHHPAFHRPPLGRSQRRPGHRNSVSF